ncbi:methyl-accepting chemotaxis protein [Magnetococcales bacterium HHB-1]
MKLQTRLILSFLAGLVLVITLAQIFQYTRTMESLEHMRQQSNTLVKNMVRKTSENIYRGVERAISGSLQRGEMEKFDKIVQNQKDVPGLMEFSLYDHKGHVFSSTNNTLLPREKPANHPPLRKNIVENCVSCHEASEITRGKFAELSDSLWDILSREKDLLIRESKETIEIFHPQKVTEDCIRCHPDWTLETVGGVTHFRFSKAELIKLQNQMQTIQEEIQKSTLNTNLMVVILILVLLGPAAFFYIRSQLVRRLSHLEQQINRIAKGDLSQRIPVPEKLDEISIIAVHVNTMADNLAKTAASVGDQSQLVGDLVKTFDDTRTTLIEHSDHSRRLAEESLSKNRSLGGQITVMRDHVNQGTEHMKSVSDRSQDLTTQIGDVAGAAQSATQDVAMMAAAAEEMTGNIAGVNENLDQVNAAVQNITKSVGALEETLAMVRQQSQRAADHSMKGREQAQETSTMMDKLAVSITEVGRVVDVIKNIANQTNMLALNAAIEAAGAGEAGEGFGVVANEVKTLAAETREATETITKQINTIRENAQQSATSVLDVNEIVGVMNQINEEIADAMAEQVATTQSVSHSLKEVADAAESVTTNAHELGSGAQEVARSALEAANETETIAKLANDISSSAIEMSATTVHAMTAMDSVLTTTQETAQSSEHVQNTTQKNRDTAVIMNRSVHDLDRLAQTLKQCAIHLEQARQELDQVAS